MQWRREFRRFGCVAAVAGIQSDSRRFAAIAGTVPNERPAGRVAQWESARFTRVCTWPPSMAGIARSHWRSRLFPTASQRAQPRLRSSLRATTLNVLLLAPVGVVAM